MKIRWMNLWVKEMDEIPNTFELLYTCKECQKEFEDTDNLIHTKYGFLCDDCFLEYFDECKICEKPIDVNEELQQDEQRYIVIGQYLSGRKVFRGSEMNKGVYRIVEYPFILDNMIEEQFDVTCFEKQRELTDE